MTKSAGDLRLRDVINAEQNGDISQANWTIGEQWKWNKAKWDKGKVIVKRLIINLSAKRWEFTSKKIAKEGLGSPQPVNH